MNSTDASPPAGQTAPPTAQISKLYNVMLSQLPEPQQYHFKRELVIRAAAVMRETTANRDQPPPVAWVPVAYDFSPMPAAGNSSSTVHIAHSVDPDLEKATMDAQQSLLLLMQKEYAELKKKQQQQQQQDRIEIQPSNDPHKLTHHQQPSHALSKESTLETRGGETVIRYNEAILKHKADQSQAIQQDEAIIAKTRDNNNNINNNNKQTDGQKMISDALMEHGNLDSLQFAAGCSKKDDEEQQGGVKQEEEASLPSVDNY